jgi:hypothetical protein
VTRVTAKLDDREKKRRTVPFSFFIELKDLPRRHEDTKKKIGAKFFKNLGDFESLWLNEFRRSLFSGMTGRLFGPRLG